MKKRFALLLIVVIVFFTLVPAAYYPPDDEALRPASSLSDVSSQFFTATGTFGDFHLQGWTGLSLSWDIAYQLPQYVPSSPSTRAPPA